MSNTITLAAIQDAAEAKYGATVIDLGNEVEVELVNPLRLPKARRKRLQELQNDEFEDVQDQLAEIIQIAAKTEGAAKLLLDAVGDDVALLAQVVDTWTKGTQAGEASPSES